MSQLEAETKQIWAELQSLKRDLMSIPVFAEAYNHVVVEKEGLGTNTKSEVATVYHKGAVYDVEVQDAPHPQPYALAHQKSRKPAFSRDTPKVVYSAKPGRRATCPACRRILRVLKDAGELHPGGVYQVLGWHFATVYRHLKHLEDNDLVSKRDISAEEVPLFLAKTWVRL